MRSAGFFAGAPLRFLALFARKLLGRAALCLLALFAQELLADAFLCCLSFGFLARSSLGFLARDPCALFGYFAFSVFAGFLLRGITL